MLITVDTLRADHLGAYGYPRPTSRHIDRLAAEGVLFEVAYAPTGATCPAHATLFTSRSPIAHRLVRNGLLLADAERTLAERLREAGYETAAFVSSYPVSKAMGFDQGFDHYDDDFEGSRFTIPFKRWAGHPVSGPFDRIGEQTVDAALRWLGAREASAPLFLWLHLFDPHYPYRAPDVHIAQLHRPGREGEAQDIDLYDAEVHYADAQVGRLLAALKTLSDVPPLVVLTSDHGEGLYDHGWRGHNRHLFDEEVRIPLILHWPGQLPAGARVRQPAHLIDIAPTLAAALALEWSSPPPDGIDLLPHARGEGSPDLERPLWLQRPDYTDSKAPQGLEEPGYGVRQGPWKLVEFTRSGKRLLFDLGSDPREQRNLAYAERARADALAGRLSEWRKGESAKASDEDLSVSEEDERALRALGYTTE